MKFRFNKKYLYWGLTAVLTIIAGILFYYILFHNESLNRAVHSFITISMPIIDGLILAYLMTPILNMIESRIIKPLCHKFSISTKGKNRKRIRMISILLTVCVVFIVVYEFFSLIIPELIRSIQSIAFQFPIYVENLQGWATGLLENNPDVEALAMDLFDKYSEKMKDFLNTSVVPRLNELLISLSSSVIGFLKGMWNLIIGFIISIYILGSKETFAGQAKKIAYAFFDAGAANQIISTFRFTHTTFSGFISGKIVDSIIIGIICFFCTNIIGTPYAILVSVIIGVTNLIPFFGPWIGGVPSTLLILMINPLQALYFLILIFVIQQFDGNVLGPKILGDSTGLSGFWVIFSITIFGGVFGILGMVVGVPIFAVLYAGFKSLVNKKLAGKNLPVETQPYLTVGSIAQDNTFTEYVPVKKKRKPQNHNADIIDSISQEVISKEAMKKTE
ncbi:MAG: AI-2E family transporter [Bacillus sp. (in: Bacteria)]|nr:AI-2E family transporter [Bacillus sp. (in: firmicutes)]MCM1425881.1 AI-2E family transporter [Eubacterium sp.]